MSDMDWANISDATPSLSWPPQPSHNITNDEIERLRAELAAAIKQRDEARELYCRQIAYGLFRTTGVFDPKEIAIMRGWAGLFRVNEPAPREKEGGGA